MARGGTERCSFWFFTISLAVIVLDQITKISILNTFSLGESLNLLPIFDLTYVRNYGAAFSFLSDAGGWQRWFFTGIAIVISILLINWIIKTPKEQHLLLWSYSLILGGAVGNVTDRLMYGYVVDFLHFYYDNWHFPAFNVADIAISIGAALLILEAFLEYRYEKHHKDLSKQ